jgi:type II secretory pathway component PulJ
MPIHSRQARRTGAGRAANRGMTVVELMIAAVIGIVVLAGAGSVYLAVLRGYQAGNRKLTAQREVTLLATTLNRKIRIAAECRIYKLPDRVAPADSGDGLRLLDGAGAQLARIEWDGTKSTLVDSTGARITALKLRDVRFRRDPAHPRTIFYRYRADDERGDLVDIESASSLRN